MADKSKMTVAEILAAARKADSKGGDAPATENGDTSPANDDQAATSAEQKPAPAPKPAAPKKAAGGGRPSVAEMLAAARAEKQAGDAPASDQAKPSAKPAAQPAMAKTAPAKKAAAPAKAAPLDTQSILAAARKPTKPGPMSKAEAAAKASPAAPDARKAKAKEAIVVPPMPVKPDYARPAAARKSKEEITARRVFILGMSALAVGFLALGGTIGLWTVGAIRFMFPNILREPPMQFTVGVPEQFPPGMVDERFKAQFGVWIVNTEYEGQQQIFALKAVCTHLGCTPNWLEAEQKFKCPCHGSGFYKDGINFEGPAPRPLERYAVSIASDGQVEIDKGRSYQEEMGQWADPNSYIPV